MQVPNLIHLRVFSLNYSIVVLFSSMYNIKLRFFGLVFVFLSFISIMKLWLRIPLQKSDEDTVNETGDLGVSGHSKLYWVTVTGYELVTVKNQL